MVQAYFEHGRWRDYVESLTEIYRTRRDTMLDALAEHFPPQAEWTRPGGGLFIWATLPDFIDTTDLLARALRDNVAFVPGEAAYLDGRGRSSMRLNFSGCGEDEIREGIRRIGEVVREQVALYGTLTGPEPTGRRPPARAGGARRAGRAASCRCRAASARHEPGRRPQGRPLARAPGLAALGGAGRGRARAPRPRGGVDRRGLDLIARLRERRARRRVRGAARPRRRGRRRCRSCSRSSAIPYTGSGVLACVRSLDKVLTKHLLRRGRHPDARVLRLQRDGVQGARRRGGAAGDRGAARLPDRRQAGSGQGSALGIKFAADGRRRAGGARRGLLLRPEGAARAPRRRARPGGLDPRRRPDGPEALPVVEAVPRGRGLLRLRGPLRDRPHDVRLPRRAAGRGDRARPRARAAAPTSCSAATASRAWT